MGELVQVEAFPGMGVAPGWENNVTGREIGRSGKIRYKTMRGYKSEKVGIIWGS